MPTKPLECIPMVKCRKEIDYDWNDDLRSRYFRENRALTAKLNQISQRAAGAIGLGCAEWLYWRLRDFQGSCLLGEAIDAVWVGLSDIGRLLSLDDHPLYPSANEWLGPERGPVCSAYQLLADMAESTRSGSFAATEVSCLSQLTTHIWNSNPELMAWQKATVNRFINQFPLDRREPLGPVVVREMLDQKYVYEPTRISELIEAQLRAVNANRFIVIARSQPTKQ